MKKCYISITTIIIILITMFCPYSPAKTLSKSEIDIKLDALKPLSKVHYSWPTSPDVSDQRLYELARIMHSLSVYGPDVKKQHVDRYIYICARINKTKPTIEASFGILFSPWNKFPKEFPPVYRGSAYQQELTQFKERAQQIKKWVAESNNKYGSNVKIGAIMLDCERFKIKEKDDFWNEGMREALDAVHVIAATIFPGARIEWYGRGIRSGAKTPYCTGKEIKAPLSCSLYSVPKNIRSRETFRKTCQLAEQMGIDDVTPWVALASGYRRGLKGQYWDMDWSYDVIDSFWMGAELNHSWFGQRPERFAPYNRAKIIIFYPRPFDPRVPDWPKHFIAYVRGAGFELDLTDLGHEQ